MRPEAIFKLLSKTFEELNVFGFFAGKLQQRAHAIIVAVQLRTSMVQDKRQDELFYEAEDAEVSIASDLVKNSFLFAASRNVSGSIWASDSGMKGLRKVETFLAADDVFNAPVNNFLTPPGPIDMNIYQAFGNTSLTVPTCT